MAPKSTKSSTENDIKFSQAISAEASPRPQNSSHTEGPPRPQPFRRSSRLVLRQQHSVEQIPDALALKARGYLLGRRMAKGTFATVLRAKFYESKSPGDGPAPKPTELACKIIDQSKSKDEQFLQKFLPRELEILGQIRHPNIIQTHSIMRRNNRVFIFLQLAERGDLLTFIRKHGALPENRTRFWFYQMADAVRYLHRQDIAHRDLKCENILISANMNVKLSDFGFARTCTDPSSGTAIMSKTFCGSAAYAAPEIISTTPYNPKMADLWSLGVVLFIMLNGTMPFDEKNLKKLLRNQLGRHIQFRPEVEKVCSLEAIRMVRSLLEPDPIDRINIEEVMEEPWRASAIANKN